MYRSKHMRRRRPSSFGVKAFLLSLAVSLLAFSIIGGTVAWLITETEPVKNTFTYGDINLTLTETDAGDNDGDPNTNTYNMIPGTPISKDPKVTMKAGSEDAWVFVKLEKSTDPAFDNFMEYQMADGWTALEGVDGVYYREVAQSDSDTPFWVIKDNTITVKDSITKAELNALTAYPTLTVTAYAVQKDNVASATDAWTLATGE